MNSGNFVRCCIPPAIQVLRRAVDALPEEHGGMLRYRMKCFERLLALLPCPKDCLEADWAVQSSTIMRKFEEKAEEFEDAGADEIPNLCSALEKMMSQCKREARKIGILLLNYEPGQLSYECKYAQFYSQGSLIQQMFSEVGSDRKTLKKVLISPLEKQFAFIGDKIDMFKISVRRVENAPTRVWANQISSLLCLYWNAYIFDRSLETITGIMLSDFMLNYMPYTPSVIALHLDVLILSKKEYLWRDTTFRIQYINFLLEHLVLSGKETLHEGLVFLFSFLLDTETRNYKESEELRQVIEVEIYDIIVTEVPSVFCVPHTPNLSTLLHRIDMVKIKVRDLYAFTPLPPVSAKFSNSLRGRGIGLLDSFLAELEYMMRQEIYYIPSIKNTMVVVQQELSSLCSLIQNKWNLKKEHEELQAVWTQVLNVAYFAGYVAYYCSNERLPTWYGIIFLPTLIEDMKLVKSKVGEIEDDVFMPKAALSSIDGIFTGFEDEEKLILDELLGEEEKLTTISILGMGGQGKTSLAKRLYNHPSIHYYFFKKVWCSVALQCNLETLLMNIARDLGGNIDNKIEHSIEEYLKGKRYLIVLDSVWDSDRLEVVLNALPNDENGSRILITSRVYIKFWDSKSNFISRPLRFFTNEESWELMQKLVFDCDECPLDLLKIGKEIAVSCIGLPLAVALIASVLKKKNAQLELWEKVATNLMLHLVSEGFGEVLALSYEHLPAYLKPYFLYFGSFPRGQNISVKKLKLLWGTDGVMVEESGRELAYDTLDEIVQHSLVVPAIGGTNSKMKSCKVHELLYDICLDRGLEKNFLHLIDGNTVLGECHSNPQKYEFQFQQRLCIHQAGSFAPPKSVCTTKQLSASQVHSILISGYSPGLRQPLSSFLSRFMVLTILDLEDLYLPEFPLVILQNIHLRYLALRGLIEHISPSVADLCDLEILIVRRGSLSAVELPDTFWAKKSLKYVHIDRIGLPNSLNGNAACRIQILSGILVEYGLKVEESMRRFLWLTKLKCYCNGVLDPMWFGCLKGLESLQVRNGYGGHSLIIPNQSFSALHLPNSLKKLVLEECRLPWSVMSTIGGLPNLEVLKLRKWACVGTTWELGEGVFSKLLCLELCDLDLERIDKSDCKVQPFTWLRKLLLIRCLGLEDIPSCFSVRHLLETVNVSGTPIASYLVREFKKQCDQYRSLGTFLQVLGLDYDDDA